MADLRREFQFYLAHKAEFMAKHAGRFVALKDQEIIGVFDDRLTAIMETAKAHELGSFLVQQVTEFADQARFHSRRGP